jgi:negative regulator of flagellin synthesis FlgM
VLFRSSRLAAKAKAATEAAPEVRVEKVDALKAQINAGDYKVDPDKVAQKLVEEHLSELI